MAKKQKRERKSLSGRQQVRRDGLKGPFPEKGTLPYHEEYILVQWFTVEANEQGIEQWLAEADQGHRQGWAERFKRMLQAIIANERARSLVCRYLVMLEQDDMGGVSYVEEHYGGETSFVDVLFEVADCFLPEDKEWLLSWQEADLSAVGPDTLVEGLLAGFQVKASGFHVQEDTIFPPRSRPR